MRLTLAQIRDCLGAVGDLFEAEDMLVTRVATDSRLTGEGDLFVCLSGQKFGGHMFAHEAVRPVDVRLTPDEVKEFLPRDLLRLYTLVWQRFIASQMAAARFHDTTALIQAGRTLWRAKGERLLFPGFLKVYGRDEDEQTSQLPKLSPGQTLTVNKLETEQKFTQPPPRFTEASLVKELEDKGIGRPSTYAAIISTLIDRDYARLEEKKFVPSELGTTVSDCSPPTSPPSWTWASPPTWRSSSTRWPRASRTGSSS